MKFKRGDLVEYVLPFDRKFMGIVLKECIAEHFLVYWFNDKIYLLEYETFLQKVKT